MSRRHTKRRRKRYEPGSAYAGHVRPRGVFGIFSNVRLFMIMGVLIMVGSLGIGGLFGSGLFTNGGRQGQSQDFVRPGDDEGDDATAEAEATRTVKQYQAPPPLTIDPGKRYLATIRTEKGDIQVELFAGQVPQTVNNFIFLARDGFYDGLSFRVSPSFSAQAGDPTNEWRAEQDAGYDLPQEAPGDFQEGILGMVNSSQFFIALTDSDEFSAYTPFGRVVSGREVAQQLTRGSEIQSIEVQEQ